VLAGVLVIAGCLAVRGAAAEPKELLLAAARGPGHPTVRRGENCLGVEQRSLPLPSTVPASQFVEYEKRFLAFLQRGEYRKLGWCVDKGVRDTGPFIEGVYYGTHPAVRIYYSPTYMRWLTGGRQGTIPDGAMVIKEQYPPPAARYAGLTDAQLPAASDWTIMYKDAGGSKDGWFWAEFFDGMTFDDDQFPFQYPWAGFGLYCLRCHSIAEREHTFGSLNNIKGFPGQPIVFADDGSWQVMPPTMSAFHGTGHLEAVPPRLETGPDPEFLRIFNSIPAVPLPSVQTLPSETYDHIVAPARAATCRAAITAPRRTSTLRSSRRRSRSSRTRRIRRPSTPCRYRTVP
jgi:hypothetical protein